MKSQAKASRPDFKIEKTVSGLVCGIDEVGRAPLAGPVVAACVYIPEENRRKRIWSKVNDSKLFARKTRETLYKDVIEHCHFSIGRACQREIENLNIVQASFLAMERAYSALIQDRGIEMQAALIDGHIKPALPCAARAVVKGDSKSVSIAAASILAKVTRDRYMNKLAESHPHYGWERNAGYGTREHLEAINTHGITIYHRKSFEAVRNYIDYGVTHRQLKIVF